MRDSNSVNLTNKQNSRKTIDHRSATFDHGIRPVLILVQLLLLFPVSGLYSRHQLKLNYNWFSIIALLSFISLSFSIFEFVCIILNFTAISFSMFNLIIYFLVNMVAEMLLIILAIRWPPIIRHWTKIDNIFLQLKYNYKIVYLLKYKLRIFAFLMIILAVAEHCVFLMSEILTEHEKFQICDVVQKNYLVEFYNNNKPYLAAFISYNPVIMAAVFYNNFKHVICSILIDTMIIWQSIGLATRFNQLFERLKSQHKQRILSTLFWIEIRTHYVLLLEHVQFINDKLSWFILLSCTSNVYFLVKLVSNLYVSSMRFLPTVIYNWVTVVFILFRICFVIYAAASLDHAIKRPLRVIREIPFSLWTHDVGRLYETIIDAKPLTGKKFFYITRKTLIGIVGTLITYELVLLDTVDRQQSTTRCAN